MDAPPASGWTLHVGEGGFSFCVAMVTKWPRDQYDRIVATSLESEETILKHRHAVENIEWLKDKGVEVHLSVDATCLHNHSQLSGRKFSRIVFNFPHAGGKSNHKKNRTLLNDFFASAVRVLDNQGQILVTLCKGQGGTPADRPMRDWHDSWQVVSMAANSGLILVQALPFCVGDYSSYTSTGFRSLDKAFHTEHAVTHVFEMATLVTTPQDSSGVAIAIQGRQFTCPRYLYEKLHDIRKIERNHHHPVNILYHSLKRALSTAFDIEMDAGPDREMCQPLHSGPIKSVVPKSETKSVSVDSIGCEDQSERVPNEALADHPATCNSILHPTDNMSNDVISTETFDDFLSLNISLLNMKEMEVIVQCSDETEYSEYHCQYSLFDTFVNCLKQQGNFFNIRCIYGPVFRPCVIKPNLAPVQFEMLFSVPVFKDFIKVDNRSDVKSEIHLDGLEISNNSQLCTTIEVVVNTLQGVIGNKVEYKFIESETEETLIAELLVDLEDDNDHVGRLGHSLSGKHCDAEELTKEIKSKNCDIHTTTEESMKEMCVDKTDMEIGEVYTVNCRNGKTKSCSMAVFVLYLDRLSVLKFAIPDQRFLWSEDRRVYSQFVKFSELEKSADEKQTHEAKSSACTINISRAQFTTPSLYPMTVTHDMSFWENNKIPFDEIHYCSIIRNIAGDHVISVTLMDRFTDCEADDCRTSRCYRLVFQSCDQCLSYSASWMLQSIIRLEVQKHLKIELR